MKCFLKWLTANGRVWRLVIGVGVAWLGVGYEAVRGQNLCLNPGPSTTTGSFVINKTRACVNTPVTVTNTLAGATNISYAYQYDGNGLPTGNQATPNTTNTYSSAGSFTILQAASSNATGAIACKTVTILPNDKIAFATQSCGNLTGILTFGLDANTSQYDQVLVDWGDGNTNLYSIATIKTGAPVSHPYANTNPRTVRVTGLYNGVPDCNAQASTQPIIPVSTPTATPIISNLSTVDGNTISMRVQGPVNTPIQIWLKDASGTYQHTGLTATDGQTRTINVNTAQSQCFQVRTTGSCASAPSTDEYCSIAINAQSGSGQVDVTWQPYTGSTSGNFQWRLLRNGFPYAIPGATNKTTAKYTDQNDIKCGQQYCYQLSATVGPATIVSNSVCVTGSNSEKPNPMTDILVNVENDGSVKYRALEPTVGATTNFTMIITRADSPSGPFEPVGSTTNERIFTDKSARASSQAYCYRAIYRNECGLESEPSEPACSIWLTSRAPGSLDWTPASPFGPNPVVEYEVEISNRTTGAVIRRQTLGSNTHFEPDRSDPDLANYRFVIVATAANGFSSRSNPYELNLEAGIFAPTAFSPNGDGQNDRFFARGFFSDNYRLTVYNRWGNVVYSTDSPKEEDGWNGTVDGQPAPAGTYTWRVEVRDQSGKKTVRIDSVLLIR